MTIDTGDFIPLPDGASLAILYAQHAGREQLYSGGALLPGSYKLTSDVAAARYVHFFRWAGKPSAFSILLPYGHLQSQNNAASLGSAAGLGDLVTSWTLWPFSDASSGRHIGFTGYVVAPTGKYERAQPLNLGENRWRVIGQTGWVYPVTPSITFDGALDVTVHGHNTDANVAGQTLRQRPSVQLQTFLRYNWSPTVAVHAGLSRSRIGGQDLNGQSLDNRATLTSWQLGASAFVAPTVQVLTTVGRDWRPVGDSGSLQFKEKARFNLRLVKVF